MRKPLWPYWLVFQSNVMVFNYEEYGKRCGKYLQQIACGRQQTHF
jgi:hypothetical protein